MSSASLAAAALPVLLLSFFTIAAAQQQPPPSPPATIRVDVDLVNVGALVIDSHGKLVEGLHQQDFHVFDNNVEQPIAQFAPIEEPGQVLFLIEAGPAVYLLQDTHLLAADALLSGLSPGDRVAIASYDEAPTGILNFTADKGAAQATLDQLRFNLGFGQLNLSSSLNTVLDWIAQVPGKKTVLLLSTGVDTSPAASIQALQTRLQLGDVRVLCVSMSGPLRNGKEGGKRVVQQAQQVFATADARLKALADATGGIAYFPENAKALQDAYRQVAQLVRHEYSLAFIPPAEDGAIHTIDVKVDLPGIRTNGKDSAYRVEHRKAYRAPASPAGP